MFLPAGRLSTPDDELDQQWDRIKRSEKTHNKSCLADHLPGNLPALQKAQKLLSRVKRDQREAELPRSSKSLIAAENRTAGQSVKTQIDEDVLGQTLFEIVRLAHEAGLDAESALRRTIKKITADLDQ